MNKHKTAPEDFQRQIFQELKELEEQKTKEVLELVQRKHMLIKWEGKRERARTLQRLESSRATGRWYGAQPTTILLSFMLILIGLWHRRSNVGFLSDGKRCRRGDA